MADMANKLAMTSLLRFLPPGEQMPGGMVVTCAYVAVLLLRAPYIRKGALLCTPHDHVLTFLGRR